MVYAAPHTEWSETQNTTMLEVFPPQYNRHKQLACLFLIVFGPKIGMNGPPRAEISLFECDLRWLMAPPTERVITQNVTMLEVFPPQYNRHKQLACLFLIVFDQKMGSIGRPQAEIAMVVVDGSGDYCVVMKSSRLPLILHCNCMGRER